jgi:hypothetical protein
MYYWRATPVHVVARDLGRVFAIGCKQGTLGTDRGTLRASVCLFRCTGKNTRVQLQWDREQCGNRLHSSCHGS